MPETSPCLSRIPASSVSIRDSTSAERSVRTHPVFSGGAQDTSSARRNKDSWLLIIVIRPSIRIAGHRTAASEPSKHLSVQYRIFFTDDAKTCFDRLSFCPPLPAEANCGTRLEKNRKKCKVPADIQSSVSILNGQEANCPGKRRRKWPEKDLSYLFFYLCL